LLGEYAAESVENWNSLDTQWRDVFKDDLQGLVGADHAEEDTPVLGEG
jgi:hypothetical protein